MLEAFAARHVPASMHQDRTQHVQPTPTDPKNPAPSTITKASHVPLLILAGAIKAGLSHYYGGHALLIH